MKINLIKIVSSTFIIAVFGLVAIGSLEDDNNGNSTNVKGNDTNVTEPTPKPTQEISIETINFDDLPTNYQDQIEGAGCAFSLSPEGDAINLNGLMKINGLYELLNYTEINDRKTMLYINKNWEFQINIEYEKTGEPGDGSELEGTATLKSRNTNDVKKFKVFGGCGC